MTRKRRAKATTPKKLLDIVIAVMGQFELLGECLDSIPEAVGNFEYNVICVDNASPKEEADEFYSQREGNIFTIRNKENLGFPKACNQGARRKSSPLIFFLNSDVILEPNAIDILVREMDNPTIGIAGMMLMFPEYAGGLNHQIRPAGTIQHIGMETDIHGNFIHSYLGWRVDHPKVLAQRDVYAVTGAALMTRRNLWNKIGGFNEAYGLGCYEDVEFCMVVRELGYNIVVAPDAKGIHYTGATAERNQIGFPLQQNKITFLQKWGSKLKWTSWDKW